MAEGIRMLADCCRALATAPLRHAHPRQPDRRLLAAFADAGARAGLPPARGHVTVTALLQTRQAVPAAFVAEGVARPLRVTTGMAAFLVEHRSARFLVDPAMCADAHRSVLPELPWALRAAVTPPRPVAALPELLARAGVGPDALDFVLATHLHWDHVCGLADLPAGLAVRVREAELAFALGGRGRYRTPPGVARGPLRGLPFRPLELDGPPVLTFDRSHDVFADGSVLVVDLAGHTPGSTGVLLRLAGGRRVLLAGDAAWHRLQVTRLREKAPFPGQLVDADRDLAFRTLHRLHALPPGIEVVPAHDHAAAAALVARG